MQQNKRVQFLLTHFLVELLQHVVKATLVVPCLSLGLTRRCARTFRRFFIKRNESNKTIVIEFNVRTTQKNL